MRSSLLCLALALLTVSLWAQTAPMQHPMHHDMAAMHQAHMQQMKDQVAKMRAALDQMKVNLAKVKDPALKQQSQLDVDLWEGLVQHMEGMVTMMSDHAGMGMMGGMHQDGMSCCAGMKDGSCCGGNKCTQGMNEKAAPPAADNSGKQ